MGKIIILYGARQVGKTTLSRMIADHLAPDEYKYIDCDLIENRQALGLQDYQSLQRFIGKYKLVIIDEAQRVKDIGLTLKILHQYMPDTQFIATGSSSFDLSNQISEPLTGRSLEFLIAPLSAHEIKPPQEYSISKSQLKTLLLYGSYPEVINNPQQAQIYLKQLASNYLYKDILELESLKKSDQLLQLLQLLAWQIGNEVSYREIGQKLGLSSTTVQKYISLLEKSFIIYRLPSYKKNLRNEITKNQKIYFWDLGIRNGLIGQFGDLEVRNDVGALWENFVIIERQKHLHNNQILKNSYFWRNHAGAEIDYVELNMEGSIGLRECKRNSNKKVKIPKAFTDEYRYESYMIITPDTIDQVRKA